MTPAPTGSFSPKIGCELSFLAILSPGVAIGAAPIGVPIIYFEPYCGLGLHGRNKTAKGYCMKVKTAKDKFLKDGHKGRTEL